MLENLVIQEMREKLNPYLGPFISVRNSDLRIWKWCMVGMTCLHCDAFGSCITGRNCCNS